MSSHAVRDVSSMTTVSPTIDTAMREAMLIDPIVDTVSRLQTSVRGESETEIESYLPCNASRGGELPCDSEKPHLADHVRL